MQTRLNSTVPITSPVRLKIRGNANAPIPIRMLNEYTKATYVVIVSPVPQNDIPLFDSQDMNMCSSFQYSLKQNMI